MRTLYIPIILAATCLASGCSIKQTVTPAELSSEMTPEICLIPAEGLREGFNTAYEKPAQKTKDFIRASFRQVVTLPAALFQRLISVLGRGT